MKIKLDPTSNLEYIGQGQYPFNPLFSSPDPRFLAHMENVATDILGNIREAQKKGFPSTIGRRRSQKDRVRSGAFFAGLTHAYVERHPRKYPFIEITSSGPNALNYETAHNTMKRELLKAAGTR